MEGRGEEVLGGGAAAGRAQSKSVAGGDPDVRAALLFDDNLHLVVHLLEAVTVHDGYTHTHTQNQSIHCFVIPTCPPLHTQCTTSGFTCETFQEVLLQFDGSIQSFPRLLFRQTLVQIPVHTDTHTYTDSPNALLSPTNTDLIVTPV